MFILFRWKKYTHYQKLRSHLYLCQEQYKIQVLGYENIISQISPYWQPVTVQWYQGTLSFKSCQFWPPKWIFGGVTFMLKFKCWRMERLVIRTISLVSATFLVECYLKIQRQVYVGSATIWYRMLYILIWDFVVIVIYRFTSLAAYCWKASFWKLWNVKSCILYWLDVPTWRNGESKYFASNRLLPGHSRESWLWRYMDWWTLQL